MGCLLQLLPPGCPRPQYQYRELRAQCLLSYFVLRRSIRRLVRALEPLVVKKPANAIIFRYIRYTGHVKYPALVAIPIYLLGTALIIYFRVPGAQVGYLAMCQVLVGFGAGVLNQMSQLITMASVRHQDVAVALAIYGLFGSVGSSVGYAVAGGIWTNILPVKLYEFLPEDSKNMTAAIYGDINKQMEYPIGTPIRDAVIEAYGDVMRKMVIVGSALIPLTIICVIVWRNINVKKLETVEKRSRGNVF